MGESGGRAETLLEVSDLRVEFRGRRTVHAVRGLSYSVGRGETFGLVGESGCGKSVSALAILGLLPKAPASVTTGSVRFLGDELVGATEEKLRSIRGSAVSLVFQDPLSSLNPVLTIGTQLSEQIEAHRGIDGKQARARAAGLLELVRIPAPTQQLQAYPHQLSGGMRQRAMIAMALSCEPRLLIADEPTTALDVTIQAQVLDLLRSLRDELGMALILITHDLGVVAGTVDRVGVMYAGRIVESGDVIDLLTQPRHPYTGGLLGSIPRVDRPQRSRLTPIPGAPPDLSAPLFGCPFRPRCGSAIEACAEDPPLVEHESGRAVACWSPLASTEQMRWS